MALCTTLPWKLDCVHHDMPAALTTHLACVGTGAPPYPRHSRPLNSVLGRGYTHTHTHTHTHTRTHAHTPSHAHAVAPYRPSCRVPCLSNCRCSNPSCSRCVCMFEGKQDECTGLCVACVVSHRVCMVVSAGELGWRPASTQDGAPNTAVLRLASRASAGGARKPSAAHRTGRQQQQRSNSGRGGSCVFALALSGCTGGRVTQPCSRCIGLPWLPGAWGFNRSGRGGGGGGFGAVWWSWCCYSHQWAVWRRRCGARQ